MYGDNPVFVVYVATMLLACVAVAVVYYMTMRRGNAISSYQERDTVTCPVTVLDDAGNVMACLEVSSAADGARYRAHAVHIRAGYRFTAYSSTNYGGNAVVNELGPAQIKAPTPEGWIIASYRVDFSFNSADAPANASCSALLSADTGGEICLRLRKGETETRIDGDVSLSAKVLRLDAGLALEAFSDSVPTAPATRIVSVGASASTPPVVEGTSFRLTACSVTWTALPRPDGSEATDGIVVASQTPDQKTSQLSQLRQKDVDLRGAPVHAAWVREGYIMIARRLDGSVATIATGPVTVTADDSGKLDMESWSYVVVVPTWLVGACSVTLQDATRGRSVCLPVGTSISAKAVPFIITSFKVGTGYDLEITDAEQNVHRLRGPMEMTSLQELDFLRSRTAITFRARKCMSA